MQVRHTFSSLQTSPLVQLASIPSMYIQSEVSFTCLLHACMPNICVLLCVLEATSSGVFVKAVFPGADFILAEDTRHSRKLLSYFGIITQQHSFHEHNEHAKEAQVIHSVWAHKSSPSCAREHQHRSMHMNSLQQLSFSGALACSSGVGAAGTRRCRRSDQ